MLQSGAPQLELCTSQRLRGVPDCDSAHGPRIGVLPCDPAVTSTAPGQEASCLVGQADAKGSCEFS